jgi:hypothetical protein
MPKRYHAACITRLDAWLSDDSLPMHHRASAAFAMVRTMAYTVAHTAVYAAWSTA